MSASIDRPPARVAPGRTDVLVAARAAAPLSTRPSRGFVTTSLRRFVRDRLSMAALALFLVIVLVLYLVQRLPLDARAKQIVQIIVIIIGIVSLLKYLAVF